MEGTASIPCGGTLSCARGWCLQGKASPATLVTPPCATVTDDDSPFMPLLKSLYKNMFATAVATTAELPGTAAASSSFASPIDVNTADAAEASMGLLKRGLKFGDKALHFVAGLQWNGQGSAQKATTYISKQLYDMELMVCYQAS